ncbi:putative sulfate/molybdate transporter [Desulforamulus ferrireducens]|uniref:Sulfate transporter n=1 Tax=Desulforamulus ferrireducens TaxID=1833852 RepID=A0A1S6IZJ6_9FIRM|nr:putative sulfate/molybdate transporter [Desulforamulus ferrireducens]AQS60179.1 sulfate transporter [Desulforamulus ferrireducens]
MSQPPGTATQTKPLKNRYDKTEWAGAFGDLGTLIPFIVGYITVMKMDPLGVLFMFGILLIIAGSYYKTPIPIQPMKAIGGAAITQAAVITPGMVWGSGIFTGLFWLIIGATGALNWISKITTKPVIRGIVLGLGLSFIMEGTRMMKTDFLVAAIAIVITFMLLTNKRIPAMFALLIFGVIVALVKNPGLIQELAGIKFDFRLPQFALGELTWTDFVKGSLILAIPQIPLTLGNAVIAVTAENNRLFPERPVTEKKIAMSQGILNLISPIFGGIPMCHGAGGMAGHVRFGARTGGATVILGCILLVIALCFSSSVLLIFKIFPTSVLGVILFFAGLELAVSARDVGKEKSDYYTLLVTAGFAIWNMGIGFLAGLIMQECLKRKIFKV